MRALLQALPEAAVTRSLGWPEPPSALQDAIRTVLRLRSRLANHWQRLVPSRGTRFFSERPTPSYGARFALSQLGPPPLLPMLNRARWQGHQRRIGLTGGIASGKSSVGQLLAVGGLPLLDADRFAREALAPGSPGARAVLERYGERVRADTDSGRPDGDSGGGDPNPAGSCSSRPTPPGGELSSFGETAIDRAALGRIVFHDADERRWLEELVHPLVRQRFASELERLADAPAVVLMIPLLFEAGLEGLCSEVWLVDCEPEQQLARLMGRDDLSEADARARLAAQWPLERKRPLVDVLIDNRKALNTLAGQVEAALQRHQ